VGPLYTSHFFAHHHDGAHRSAMVILPIVFKRAIIKSIVDFGCGTGTWLRCAADIGLSDIQGLDGEWVLTDDLCIAPHQFRRTDLTKPVALDRKYDLAICLEVAEHLPASSACTLVVRPHTVFSRYSQATRTTSHQRAVARLLGRTIRPKRICGFRHHPPRDLGAARC
jgi:2-polyprenyl-3-methyl-5-hydroxy-6-metoxy-1,4-benzoquinol methylase